MIEMRKITETKEINIYTLENVLQNKELLEKILEREREANIDMFDANFIIEDFTEKLEGLGYENIKTAYTGFFNQGDGASFTGIISLTSEVLERLGVLKGLKNSQIELIDEYIISAEIYRHNRNYVHENSTTSDVEIEYTHKTRIDNFLLEIANSIEKSLDKEIYDLNCEFYENLKSYYEYTQTDSYILETLRDNEYEFYEDGSIV